MAIFPFAKLNPDASRTQLFSSFIFVLICVSTPVLTVIHDIPMLIATFAVIAGTLQSYQITRWIYALKPGVRRPVMTLWLSTLTLMIINTFLWTIQGEAYEAHGLLGNAVDIGVTVFFIVLWDQARPMTSTKSL